MSSRRSNFVALLVLLAWLLIPRAVEAAPGFTDSCPRALAKQQVDELIAAMRAATPAIAEGEAETAKRCALERLDTALFQTRIRWTVDGETVEALLAPKGCLREPSHVGEDLAYYAPAELDPRCPAAAAALRAFVGEPREELVEVVRTRALALDLDEDPVLGPARTGLVLASAAWIGALVLALIMAWRHRRSLPAPGTAARRELRASALALAAMFVLALVARASVAATVANWYGPFVPPAGLGELRFGTAATVLQVAVRALLPWTEGVAFGLWRLLGALAVPLVMVMVRRLGGSRSAMLVAGLLLALAPIAVRLSASSAEHVLAATLAVAAWTVWLRTASDESVVPRLLTIALVVLAVLTRVDCWPQLLLIPLWTVLAEPRPSPTSASTQTRWAPRARRVGDALFFVLAWAALGVYAYFDIVLRSQHPGPTSADMVEAAKVLVTQLGVASAADPHWLSPICLALVVLGVVACVALRRFGLLLAAALSLALIFVPLGRNLTHDGLTGARYFVLALPLLVVVASLAADGGERLVERVAPERRAWIRWIALALLALAELIAVQPAWRYTYAFQVEYQFLAAQLDARELDGCTLWFVRPRQPTNEDDLDCCLAPDRSPLALVAPELELRAVPHGRPLDAGNGCQLYYRGAVCSLAPELIPEAPKTLARIAAQCEALETAAIGTASFGSQELPVHSLKPRWTAPPFVELHGPTALAPE